MNRTEQQLEELRERIREIRIACKWLQEFRINAPPAISKALSSYHTYLLEQETRTMEMGKRIKAES